MINKIIFSLEKYGLIFEPLKKLITELGSETKSSEEQKKFENLNIELLNQEDKFQELVINYNKISPSNKIFVNSSLIGNNSSKSGGRFTLQKNEESNFYL